MTSGYRAVAKRRVAYAAMPRLGTFQEKQKTCQTKVWRSLVFPARSQSFFLCVLYAFRVNPVFLRHANLIVGVPREAGRLEVGLTKRRVAYAPMTITTKIALDSGLFSWLFDNLQDVLN